MSCPICNRKADKAYRPFCSKRCADVDLAKWMTGSYAIPSDDPLEEEDIDAVEEGLKNRPH